MQFASANAHKIVRIIAILAKSNNHNNNTKKKGEANDAFGIFLIDNDTNWTSAFLG
jgi:hypothetical protein